MALGRVWRKFSELLGSTTKRVARPPLIEPVFDTPKQPDPKKPSPPTPPSTQPPTLWGRDRIAVVESLWGEGFIFPAGEQETLRLAKPLALSQATSLLLVGAGTGGPASCIAAQLGAWVTAFEANPDLAELAMQRSSRNGLGRRAEIKTWDPTQPNFSRRSFHHALALEPLRGEAAGPVLVAMFRAIRPGGELMMVDLVADEPLDPMDEAVLAWCQLEGRPPVVPTHRAITGALGRLGFDVRVTEDISLRHMQQALHGWHALLRGMREKKPSPALAKVLVTEAELWLRRSSLIREKRLRMVRWDAIRSTAAA